MSINTLNLPDQPNPWNDGDRWDPEDGESITGKVVERKSLTSERYGREFEVLVLANGDGNEVDVSCARAHLAALVREHDPQPGDVVAIRHWDPASGERAHRYAMRVLTAGAEIQ